MRKTLRYLFIAGLVLGMGAEVSVPYIAWEVRAEAQELENVEHPQINTYGIRKLTLVKDGEEIFQISYEPEEYKMSFDYWEILNPYEEAVTVDTEAMYDLYSNIASLNLRDPEEEVKIDTGIASSNASILIEYVNTLDDETARSTADADSRAELILGEENGNGYTYAAVKGYENQVYTLPSELINNIMGLEPFDYILKIPVLVNIETLESVEITAGNKEYVMSIEDGKYKFDGKTVKKEEFTSLYQALQSVILKEETAGEAKEEPEEILKMIFKRSGEEMPDEELVYSSFDEESYLLSINGTVKFMVSKEEVDELLKQIKKDF